MKKANQLAPQRTAVDILNAVILLIKLEGERFNWYKQKAWERDNQLLTEQGLELMEEAFADVDIREFWINVTKEEALHKCTMSRMKSTSEFTVTIPMKDMIVGRRGTNQLRLLERYLDVLVKHTTEIPPPTALLEETIPDCLSRRRIVKMIYFKL